jgi:hypothetical protein
MKNCLLLTFLLFASLPVLAQKGATDKDWVSLFNGKDLTGWDAKIAGHPLNDNVGKTFRAENGMLRIAYDQPIYDRFDGKYGHLYYNKPFSYYILRFDYRFQGEQVKGGDSWNVRNSGIMIHSQSAQSVELKQAFPVSLEVQLLGGLGKGTRHTANLCTPGTQVYIDSKLNTQHCIDSESKTYDGDQWVSVEVVVLGDSVRHLIDGKTVLAYGKTQIGGGYVSADYDWAKAGIEHPDEWIRRANTALTEGFIALQSESHAIDFRNIKLLDLKGCTDPKASNYKAYYQKSDPKACRYK